MGSRAQAESVIKNIIREIAQECAGKGQAVSETLVAFMVKAVVLDPTNQFNIDRTLTKDDVQKLIKICVERLLDNKSPSLDTIKMQVYFDMNYTTRSDFLQEHRRVLDTRLLPVVREITDGRARTREELESLYRKIVSVLLLRSGLGSPTDITVVREATAALQSVFPQTELGTFLSLTKIDKERQLKELTMIVSGIRLFNKECGKGGEGIDDLPAILNEAIPATTQNIDSEIQSTQTRAFQYTAIIEDMIRARHKDTILIDTFKEALINARQHEACLRVLLQDVLNCAMQVEHLHEELNTRLHTLHATVQSKTAVPTAQVYPQFVHLAQLWSSFQDNMVLLSVLSNILVSLEPYTRGHRHMFSEEFLQVKLANVKVFSDEDRIEATNHDRVDIQKDEFRRLDWLFPETTKNFMKLPLMYKGYCGWALVQCDRLLIPTNPNIGVLHYKDCYFAFSSKTAAEQFALNVDSYMKTVTENAKKSPELIQLLDLHKQFSTMGPYGKGRMITKPVSKSDAEVQTDVHPVEYNIVKTYEWNEWELRRKAIKLTNLRNKLTHSIQTNLSHYRRDVSLQIYPPKEKGTQTKFVKGSNVPKPQVFLAGLRGVGLDKPTDMTKVDLTIDAEDSY